jgi:hypothetical protein
MAKLQGQTEAVGNAFRKQIPGSEALLNRLRKATHGTVGDLELMQRSLKFQNFGADVQKLPQLLEFAAIRAQQTGESVDYMVNSIVNGIGRKSLLILDNLGISASRLKEQFHGVSLQSLSVAEVTQGVAEIMEEEMKKMGGYAENAATKVDQITVAHQELRVEIAKRIESGGVLDFFKEVLDGAKLFVQAFPKMEKENFIPVYGFFKTLNDFRENLNALVKVQTAENMALQEFAEFEKEANKEREKALTLAQLQIVANVERLNANNKEIKSWKEKIATLDQAAIADRNQIAEGNKAILYYEGQNIKLNKLNDLLKDYIIVQQQATEATKKQGEAMKDLGLQIDLTFKPINFQNDLDKIADNLNLGMYKVDEKIEIEIEPEIVLSDSWAGGNEKAARFRLAMKEWFKENQDDIIGEGIDFTSGLLQTAVDAEMAHYQLRLANLQNFYDRQNLLAGDNERYKKELALRQQRDTLKIERDQAQAQKRARKFSILIDTAASIAKAWVNPGYPGAIPLTVFLAAQGIAQGAIVDKANPGFKEGVIDLKGPGTRTSDSIPANLSRGESVITAAATEASPMTLKLIQAKKLDDRKLARIIAKAKGTDGAVMDLQQVEGLLGKIASNTQGSDFIQKGVTLYEVKQAREGMTRIIRQKVING